MDPLKHIETIGYIKKNPALTTESFKIFLSNFNKTQLIQNAIFKILDNETIRHQGQNPDWDESFGLEYFRSPSSTGMFISNEEKTIIEETITKIKSDLNILKDYSFLKEQLGAVV
ncbi:MAG: hypothetical protein PWR01_3922 [Clostridiales bacterium]|nr:hypothetical protein [Clostridiales bacterium]MDN5282849.1 hypothetical protein [Candidatus Ozemobacter sp.]